MGSGLENLYVWKWLTDGWKECEYIVSFHCSLNIILILICYICPIFFFCLGRLSLVVWSFMIGFGVSGEFAFIVLVVGLFLSFTSRKNFFFEWFVISFSDFSLVSLFIRVLGLLIDLFTFLSLSICFPFLCPFLFCEENPSLYLLIFYFPILTFIFSVSKSLFSKRYFSYYKINEH